MVPRAIKFLIMALLMVVALLLSSCTVLVESDAFGTLVAPTDRLPTMTAPSSASPDQTVTVEIMTPTAQAGPTAVAPEQLPMTWLRDLAWEELMESGIAEGPGSPPWDDACGRNVSCWGSWRMQIRRLAPDVEVDRFLVIANGPHGIVCEMVVTSDGVTQIQATATATPWPTKSPRPTATVVQALDRFVITVHSLPPASAFDAMARLWSVGGQQIGVQGADEALEAALVGLRDTGRFVSVDAWREEDVPDYAGARLIVEAIPDVGRLPERGSGDRVVEGWLGRLVTLPESAAYDHYFDCRWPGGQYGIAATDKELEKALVGLREEAQLVRVWGLLQEDVDDYGQARILVSRIELADLSSSEE